MCDCGFDARVLAVVSRLTALTHLQMDSIWPFCHDYFRIFESPTPPRDPKIKNTNYKLKVQISNLHRLESWKLGAMVLRAQRNKYVQGSHVGLPYRLAVGLSTHASVISYRSAICLRPVLNSSWQTRGAQE